MTDAPIPTDRAGCEALDQRDALAPLRAQFALPQGVIYLDGNSLGALPRATAPRLAASVEREWGQGLIGSWNSAGWVDLPSRLGDRIGRLVGAAPGQVVVADSTSVNLFKVLSAALKMRPGRSTIVSERGNFPTDLYIAQGVAAQLGGAHRLVLVDRDGIAAALDDDTAVLMLTQVDYRTGSKLDMAAVTQLAHRAGALTVWDLAHSAGAFPVALDACEADFAIGCGYKYLNGGPGAPAFLYAATRHQRSFAQPLSGWFGHAAPFAFETGYRPADGVSRYLCGTPPVLSMIALECGIETLLAAEPLGGLAALADKAARLSGLFIEQVERRCAAHGLVLQTPRDPALRGSQASFSLPDPAQAWAMTQALIAAGVVGDFRAPDVLRFGFAPSYLRYVDAWDAAECIARLLDERGWDRPEHHARRAVT